jgi:hypothetical protein
MAISGITEARISLGDQQFATVDLCSSVKQQSAKFSTPDGRTGFDRGCYTKETSAETEGPFFARR